MKYTDIHYDMTFDGIEVWGMPEGETSYELILVIERDEILEEYNNKHWEKTEI